jgi:hypothetical protein
MQESFSRSVVRRGWPFKTVHDIDRLTQRLRALVSEVVPDAPVAVEIKVEDQDGHGRAVHSLYELRNRADDFSLRRVSRAIVRIRKEEVGPRPGWLTLKVEASVVPQTMPPTRTVTVSLEANDLGTTTTLALEGVLKRATTEVTEAKRSKGRNAIDVPPPRWYRSPWAISLTAAAVSVLAAVLIAVLR